MPGKTLIDEVLELTKGSHVIEPGDYLMFDEDDETMFIPLGSLIRIDRNEEEPGTFKITTGNGTFERGSIVMVITVH